MCSTGGFIRILDEINPVENVGDIESGRRIGNSFAPARETLAALACFWALSGAAGQNYSGSRLEGRNADGVMANKAARFENEAHTAMVRLLEADLEAAGFEIGAEKIQLPVKFKVHDSAFVPLAR